MKNLGLWGWLFSIGMAILCGILIGRGCVKQKPRTITIETVDTTTTTIFLPETVIVCDFDTVYIDSMTPFGSIPIQDTTLKDEVLVKVNGDTLHIPIEDRIWYKGLLKRRELQVMPYTHKITELTPVVKGESFFKGYGLLAVSVSDKRRLLSEVEGGIMFGNRLGVFGRVSVNDSLVVTPRVGLKVMIK